MLLARLPSPLMDVYGDHVLSRMVDAACGMKANDPRRERAPIAPDVELCVEARGHPGDPAILLIVRFA